MTTSQLPNHVQMPKKRDYLAVRDPVSDQLDRDRVTAIRVTHVSEESVRGVEVKFAHYAEHSLEVPLSAVYANFGRNPPSIMVGGANIGEVFDKLTHYHDFWGDIHFSYKPEEEELTKILKGYDRVQKWLSRNGLEQMGSLPVVHEVTNIPKKYAGCVWAPSNLSKDPIRMRFTPSHTLAKDTTLFYVVAHEVGHIVDLGLLRDTSPKLRGKWVSAYSETMSPVALDKEACEGWLEDFLSFEDIKDFRAKMADEEAAAALKTILDHLRRTRHLSLRDLLLLREADHGAERVKELWPVARTCVSGQKKPVVSDYATTNSRELFAEAFAFYVTGAHELPAQIHELMEQSISRAQKVLPMVLKELANPSTKKEADQ